MYGYVFHFKKPENEKLYWSIRKYVKQACDLLRKNNVKYSLSEYKHQFRIYISMKNVVRHPEEIFREVNGIRIKSNELFDQNESSKEASQWLWRS